MAKTKSTTPKADKALQIGELPHKPHYEVRTASQSYSNIAAVLAGFAFAAVVLVVQTTPPSLSPDANTFRDWATIAFLLAFVGCIISAFVYATVSGEEVLAPRSHTIAFLGGMGFSISAALIIFGLATLTRIFLSPNIYGFVESIFPLVMFLTPLFVVFSALDPILGFESRPLTRKDLMQLFVPSFTPLVIAMIIKYSVGGFSVTATASFFNAMMIASFVAMAVSAASSLTISAFANIRFRLPLLACGLIIGAHSIIIGIFVLML